MPVTPSNTACWFEIAVSDLDAATAFYSSVLQQDLTIDDSGPNPVAMMASDNTSPGVGGHLYPGKPSRDGATIHLIVADSLEAARARITAAGGEIESPDIDIPPGTFFYARDIDGNSLGMFKLRN